MENQKDALIELKENINELVVTHKFGAIRKILTANEPADVAAFLSETLNGDKRLLPIIFRILPKELAAETFVEMDSDEQELLINAFSDRELKNIVDELFVDDAVDIIEEMPANVVKRILKHTDAETRNSINEILRYPKDSAGSIMTTEYVTLRTDMTVSDAFDKIRRTGVDKETIYICYVTTPARQLIGLVSVRDLLLSPYNTPISSVMEQNIIRVNTHDDKEDVAQMFDKYDFISLPVVDNECRLVGIVTFDDAIDVIREENTEDIQKMVAIQPSEESYLKTSVIKHAKNRILWLLFLMLSATVTGAIIQKYEEAFTAIPILVAFIPMLMGTGGNCGAQSSTMIIRGLALDEIKSKDILRVMLKELLIALIVGIILAAVNAIRIFIMYRGDNTVFLSLVTGVSLIGTVIIAKLLGGALPILAKLCRLDPALMASPLITTIVDTCSVTIFFNVALFVMSFMG